MDKLDFKEFQECIDRGEELSFEYNGDEYWISFSREGDFFLTRSKDSYTQIFQTAEELYANGLMEGKPFIDVYHKIDW